MFLKKKTKNMLHVYRVILFIIIDP